MAHEMTDIDRMFSVRERPWHMDETNTFVLADYPGRDVAYVAAGHDFEVEEVPTFMQAVGGPDDGGYVPIPGWNIRRRSDTKHIFTVGPDSYVTLPNTVGWDIADAILGEDNVKYETGGTLKSGAVCYVLARIDEPSVIKGDDSAIYPYVAVSWGHDGSTALKARATSVRVVCWNTLSAAEAEGARTNREFTFRHTANVRDRIEDARNALLGARDEHAKFITMANELADMSVSDEGINAFMAHFGPTAEPRNGIVSARVRNNIDEARGELRAIIDGGLTVTADNRNTAYGLVQAGVEYLDHIRGFRSRETYCRRTILRDEPAKAQLIPLARAAAAGELTTAV